jgi:cytochrome c2
MMALEASFKSTKKTALPASVTSASPWFSRLCRCHHSLPDGHAKVGPMASGAHGATPASRLTWLAAPSCLQRGAFA